MTSNPNTALQLRHLWAASHLLATTSPMVSAHLTARLLSISSEKGINLPDSVDRGVCNVCGTVAVWGLNSHVNTIRRRKGKDKAKMIMLECHMCGRSRASAILPARRRRSARQSKLKPAAIIAAAPVAVAISQAGVKAEVSVAQSSKPQAQSLANASSRKRAKTRKGNSLSEILKAKKQQQQASNGGARGGFGLDLMDLMKTG